MSLFYNSKIHLETDAFIFSPVTIGENPCDTTTNLEGPIVLNLKNSTGKQVVNEGESVRYRIGNVMQQGEESAGAVEKTSCMSGSELNNIKEECHAS